MLRRLHKVDAGLPINIVECAPTTRTMNVLGKIVHLPFPYQVFAVAYYKQEERQGTALFHAFGSLKPIMSPDDIVFIFPLPNSYANGSVCMGENRIAWNGNIKDYINIYFNSPFTAAVSTPYWQAKEGGVCAQQYWTRGSNPFTLPWHTPKLKLMDAFKGHSFALGPFTDDFTDDKIRELAEQIRPTAHGYSDEEVWLAAEKYLLQQLYNRGTSG